jgi:hypothetical protein
MAAQWTLLSGLPRVAKSSRLHWLAFMSHQEVTHIIGVFFLDTEDAF